eukprot:TRINITY_DN211_c0_g1_i5.p1 TRINITY_DN211_c0_g1~~TRINITY_DN211_c0_g1_i5.p1  ORF type:complete len:720 (-),score=159.75 TRINITY_DN211_c0_g1_i5:80-2176(-)
MGVRSILLIITLLLTVSFGDDQLEKLYKLQKLKNLGLITEQDYETRKASIVDSYIGVSSQVEKRWKAPTYKYYKNVREAHQPGATPSNWSMPMVFTPQTEWLISIFDSNMPKSYQDVLPYNGGYLYWKTKDYLRSGAFDYNGTRLPLDDIVAIQERALTHVGLNLYDAGIWSVGLSLAGFADFTGMYYRNVMYTSGTGANPQIGGLKSIRAWEPNPDPQHPPDPFYYGRDKIKNTDLTKVTMPNNVTYIRNKDGCTCPTSGCCPQEGDKQIPGNYFYRMIGPGYMMTDPLSGVYGYTWRATPAGNDPDPAQYWNLAGVIHWNDWKPITGENVWGAILGPLQHLFIKNCSHISKFSTFDNAPPEVQLAVSILPAASALISPLGSLYHCPLGTKMYPPDDDEATNVSNENNFSGWAAFKALFIVLDMYYTGGDTTLDNAKTVTSKILAGLDHWFATYLLPAQIAGQNVISQGGHVTFDGQYKYQQGSQAFAVDCQTWGLLVSGQKRFDNAYASKGVTAYQVWQNAKSLAGYYIDGALAGVGYTTEGSNSTKPDIWSGEWTWGAVFMCRKLATEYRKIGQNAWADSLEADAASMVAAMSKEVQTCADDPVWCPGGGLVLPDGSYLYANKRFFIPWGWYANPIGATSSTAWAVCYDFNYNPFMLGGGTGNETLATNPFWSQQCKTNPPDEGILDKVLAYYDY